MNTLIDISSPPNLSLHNKEIGKVANRKFALEYPIETVRESLKVLPEHKALEIDTLLDKDRNYSEKFGCKVDSHLELEKLGIGRYTKKYVTVISLADSADLLFYILMGTPIKEMRSMPNYLNFSRCLVTSTMDKLDISLEDLMNVHETIAYYILQLADRFTVSMRDPEFNRKFVAHFHTVLQKRVSDLLEIIVAAVIETHSKVDKKISLRARGLGEFVISKDDPDDINIDLVLGEFKYTLQLKTYQHFGYLYRVE